MRTKTPEQHEAEYRWLKPEEVAERIGVDSADTVRLYIRKGLLEAIDVSRSNKPRYRISPKAVEAFNAEEAGAMTQPDAVSQGEMESGVTEAGAWEVVTRMAGGANVGPRFLSLARLVVSLDKRMTEASGKLLVLTRMGESTNEDVGSLNNDAESFEQRIAYLESTLSAIQAGMDDEEAAPVPLASLDWRDAHPARPDPSGAGREDGQGEREKLADCLDGIRGFGQLFSSDHAILNRAAAALRASQADGERVEVFVDPREFEFLLSNKAEARSVCVAIWSYPQTTSDRPVTLIHPATESREAPGLTPKPAPPSLPDQKARVGRCHRCRSPLRYEEDEAAFARRDALVDLLHRTPEEEQELEALRKHILGLPVFMDDETQANADFIREAAEAIREAREARVGTLTELETQEAVRAVLRRAWQHGRGYLPDEPWAGFDDEAVKLLTRLAPSISEEP